MNDRGVMPEIRTNGDTAIVESDLEGDDTKMRHAQAIGSPAKRFKKVALGLGVSPDALLSSLEEYAARYVDLTLSQSSSLQHLTPEETRALAAGGFELNERKLEEDPLTQGILEYSILLTMGLTTREAAKILKVNASRVRQRLTSKPPTLYGIREGSKWHIPLFQFVGNRLVPGMEEVIADLDPELHPLTLYRWFTCPSPDLLPKDRPDEPISPRNWLLSGHPVEEVARLAGDL